MHQIDFSRKSKICQFSSFEVIQKVSFVISFPWLLFLPTYRVQKCKEKFIHTIRICVNVSAWKLHSIRYLYKKVGSVCYPILHQTFWPHTSTVKEKSFWSAFLFLTNFLIKLSFGKQCFQIESFSIFICTF